MKEYKTENIEISKIKIDGDNPNKLTDDMRKRLKNSIEEFGNCQPVVIDKNTMVIADGQHRLEYYKEMKKETIPSILVEFKNDTHRRTFRQAANKIHGEHTPELDAQEYLKIIESEERELLKMVTGLSMSEVQKHLRRQELLTKEEDFDLDEEIKDIKPRIKNGEVWTLGNHRLMCGDSTKEEDVSKLMDGKKADMILTDPPYGVELQNRNKDLNKRMGDSRNEGNMKNDSLDLVKEVWKDSFNNYHINSKNECSYYCFAPQGGDQMMMMMMMMISQNWQVKHELIWVKDSMVLGRADYHYQHEPIIYGWKKGEKHNFYGDRTNKSIFEIDRLKVSKEHPTMKPLELLDLLIKNSSKEEDLIIDLFGGSGSTLIACEKLERNCYMMEIDLNYCEVILRRWEKFTGKEAIKNG